MYTWLHKVWDNVHMTLFWKCHSHFSEQFPTKWLIISSSSSMQLSVSYLGWGGRCCQYGSYCMYPWDSHWALHCDGDYGLTIYISFTLRTFADAFIQSDLQTFIHKFTQQRWSQRRKRQPVHQDQSGWGILLRDTLTPDARWTRFTSWATAAPTAHVYSCIWGGINSTGLGLFRLLFSQFHYGAFGDVISEMRAWQMTAGLMWRGIRI